MHVLEVADSHPFCTSLTCTAPRDGMLSCSPHPPAPSVGARKGVGAKRGARRGLEAQLEAVGSRFSRLPASRCLEEDLLLSQGVTASREPPNLYLRCNLYLSPPV